MPRWGTSRSSSGPLHHSRFGSPDYGLHFPFIIVRNLQVFGIAFSIIGLLPSISSVLFYTVNDGGGPSMVWGVGVFMNSWLITLKPWDV